MDLTFRNNINKCIIVKPFQMYGLLEIIKAEQREKMTEEINYI